MLDYMPTTVQQKTCPGMIIKSPVGGSRFRFAIGQTAVYPKAKVTHVGMSCVSRAAVATSGSAAARWHPAFRLLRCCMEADVERHFDSLSASPSQSSHHPEREGAVSVGRSGAE
jgi:hypothetical protein